MTAFEARHGFRIQSNREHRSEPSNNSEYRKVLIAVCGLVFAVVVIATALSNLAGGDESSSESQGTAASASETLRQYNHQETAFLAEVLPFIPKPYVNEVNRGALVEMGYNAASFMAEGGSMEEAITILREAAVRRNTSHIIDRRVSMVIVRAAYYNF